MATQTSAAPKPAPEPVALPVRTGTARLNAPFVGWEAEMWLNPELRILDELGSPSLDTARAALGEVALAWNFRDRHGAPMKQPAAGGVAQCNVDVLTELIAAYDRLLTEATAVPKA